MNADKTVQHRRGSAEYRGRGITAAFALAILLTAILYAGSALAADNGQVMCWRVGTETVSLYVRNPGGHSVTTALVGSDSVDVVTITGADRPLPTVTYLLLDNSYSITYAEREKSRQLLADVVAQRSENESFIFCTFAETLTTVRESSDYAELKTCIKNVEYRDQYTYLADVLQDILTREKEREGREYVRIFLIGDGADNNPRGISLETLTGNLKEFNIPIYIAGCGEDDAALKAMANICYNTGGQYWEMADVETEVVAANMRWQELPVRVDLFIPPELRNGTTCTVEITFSNHVKASRNVPLPGEVFNPPPPPSDGTIPSGGEGEEEELDHFSIVRLLLWVLFAAAVAAGIAFGIFYLRKRHERNSVESMGMDTGPYRREEPERQGTSGGGSRQHSGSQSGRYGHTMIMGDDDEGDNETEILVKNDDQYMLSLTGINQSDRHYEVPLRGWESVSIGRNGGNRVVLDDRSVSGNHCEIFVDGNRFKVRDLRSSNGTFVDGAQVTDDAEISNGSILRLGRVEFKVGIR